MLSSVVPTSICAQQRALPFFNSIGGPEKYSFERICEWYKSVVKFHKIRVLCSSESCAGTGIHVKSVGQIWVSIHEKKHVSNSYHFASIDTLSLFLSQIYEYLCQKSLQMLSSDVPKSICSHKRAWPNFNSIGETERSCRASNDYNIAMKELVNDIR